MVTTQSEAEIAELADRYGKPRRWERTFETPRESMAWVRKTLKRRGEVVLVVPGHEGHIWLHTKSFYPASIYRLPSGGIHEGESVERAALRESFEEMGFNPELERFLGVVENYFKLPGETPIYPTFVFQTKPFIGSPQVMDHEEQISGYREATVEELAHIVEKLDSLPSDWQPWGHFRAAPHALAAAALVKL